MRLAHQIHFGSQCATESVYWHLPAKVGLKKSHFGKPSLTECTLRHPPCQSELAEAHRVICGTSASLQVHPEDTMYVKIGQVDLRKHIQLGNSLAICVSRSYPWRPFRLSALFINKIRRQAVITLQQIHFGSQCATEDVYRHLPAKVELKKSHFGKQSLIECALCSPPCQSELAELRERNKKHRAELGPVRFYKLVFTKNNQI